MKSAIDIKHLLPITKVEENSLLSMKGDLTVAYKLELPELFSLSAAELEMIHQTWIKAIKVLPAHCVLHKQDWFLTTHYKAKIKEDDSFLARCSERYFDKRPYLGHEGYLFLTKQSIENRNSSSATSGLLKKHLVPQLVLNPAKQQEFLDHAARFERILKDSGLITIRRMEEMELLGTKNSAGLLGRYLGLLPKDSAPILKDIELKDGFRIGENKCFVYSLAAAEDLPGLCGSRLTYDKYSTDQTKFSVGFASPLGMQLGENHIYNQYVFTGDPAKAIKELERKRLRLQSLSNYSRENAIARDAVNQYLNEAISQQRLPVRAHFNILCWTDRPEQEEQLKSTIVAAIAKIDAQPRLETYGAAQLYWAAMPGNAADFPLNDTFDTFAEQASCFFNNESGSKNSQSATGIRLGDRLNGKPIQVDISDEPMRKGICTNRNKFILGGSGTGKSFFTNHLLRNYYDQGAHLVLVDVGHSYKGLCDMVKGYYFTYDAKSPISFNPFYLEKGEDPDIEKRESLKTLLLALWKKESEGFSRSEYIAISNALGLYYQKLTANKSIFPCFNSFYEFLSDEFSAVIKAEGVSSKDFDLNNFLYVLKPYYKTGEFDYLLNATENLHFLSERFIVFELDLIKDHPILFPVVTLMIMEVFLSKMRKLKGIKKVILIEEAWKAIAKEGMAEYIKYLYKTVRKFYGEPILVTQDIEDIISSPVIKQAIINNSDCKILLDQRKYQNKFEVIQELLGLTDKEKTMVLSVNKANDPNLKYKEVFISLGGTHSGVYRTEVSPEEYFTYTTEETEKLKVQEYTERFGGDMEKALAVLVKEMKEQSRI